MKSTLISLIASSQAIKIKMKARQDACEALGTQRNIDPDHAILMGFSSGSYSSGHNLAVSSGAFHGAALANGSVFGQSYGSAIRARDEASQNAEIDQQVNDAIDMLESGHVDDLGNLEGAPVYIHSGLNDGSMPPANQRAQEGLFAHYGANIMYVETDSAHNAPQNMPAEALGFVLGNIEGTGVQDGEMRDPDSQLSQGRTVQFDQAPFINFAVAEHAKHGGSEDVDHRLDFTRPGYYFVPEACDFEGAECNFAIVSHGAGGAAIGFVKQFAPYAAPYKTVMVFPQAVKEWDDTGYSGPLYTTADGVQPIFYRALLDHISGDHVIVTEGLGSGECSASNKGGSGGGGDRPPRPEGERPPRPEGERPPRPEGERPPRPEGERPPRPEGERPPRPEGERPPRPEGERPPRPEGERPPRPEGERPPRPEGERPPRPEGERPPRPEGPPPGERRDKSSPHPPTRH